MAEIWAYRNNILFSLNTPRMQTILLGLEQEEKMVDLLHVQESGDDTFRLHVVLRKDRHNCVLDGEMIILIAGQAEQHGIPELDETWVTGRGVWRKDVRHEVDWLH